MTFNIRYGTAKDGENHWKLRRELVFGVFRKHKPDFVGAQEALAFQILAIAKAAPAYKHVGRSREKNPKHGEATPIFYRHDRWELKNSGTFWLSDTPDRAGSKSWGNTLPRVATWARFVEKRSGRPIVVFNTHLDHRSQPSREKSVVLIAQRMAKMRKADPDLPMVLTGDLNAAESNRAIFYLEGRGEGAPLKLVDTFRAVHPDRPYVGTMSRWMGIRIGPKIDYVFVTPGAQVLAAEILHDHTDSRYPSDHYSVTAEIEF
jgi:endonuclease/exonuclease/phosphatase family metal-dependent hydrolase